MRAERAAQDLLGAARVRPIIHQSVHVGAVEEIHATVERALDQALDFGFVGLAAQAHAQCDARDAHARGPELDVLHLTHGSRLRHTPFRCQSSGGASARWGWRRRWRVPATTGRPRDASRGPLDSARSDCANVYAQAETQRVDFIIRGPRVANLVGDIFPVQRVAHHGRQVAQHVRTARAHDPQPR